MKFYLTLLFNLFLLFNIPMQAQQQLIEPCKFGQPLIDALQDAYTPAATLGYGPARDILYSEIDNVGLDLSCIYTQFTVTLDPNADPSSSAYQGGFGINAEHVFPQSLGAGSEPAKSDLYNIFPCRVPVNSERGNCRFGEIEDTDTEKWFYLDQELNNIPTTDIDKYSEKDTEDCVFEPRESSKGDIARAMFYFYAIYQSNAGTAGANFFDLQKATLHDWHMADPVDNVEKGRDSLIALQQGNHNPFILDNSLAWRAYFVADAAWPEGDPNCFTTAISDVKPENEISIAATFVEDEVIVYGKKNTGNITLCNVKGEVLHTQKLFAETHLSVQDLPRGIYVLSIYTNQSGKAFRIFKW